MFKEDTIIFINLINDLINVYAKDNNENAEELMEVIYSKFNTGDIPERDQYG